MATPTFQDLITPSSAASGLQSESLDERILTTVSILASGTNPDGTASPGFPLSSPAILPGHLVSTGSSPSFVLGIAAGGGATFTHANCTDTRGVLTITTAGAPTDGILFTATFAATYTTTPPVVVCVGDQGVINADCFVGVGVPTLTQFLVYIGAGPLNTGTVYNFQYMVIG
jgi:hypothetical protein